VANLLDMNHPMTHLTGMSSVTTLHRPMQDSIHTTSCTSQKSRYDFT